MIRKGLRLVITWDFHDGPSIEKAIGLVERWMRQETGQQYGPVAIRSEVLRAGRRSGADSDIARRRMALGLSQAELGALAGVSGATVSQVETGAARPDGPAYADIRRALDRAEADT